MTLLAGVAEAIIAHAREAAPAECCGLLLGDADHVRGATPARNLAADPTRRYLVDPSDHFAAIRQARAQGQEVVGAYHSHPRRDAVPSVTDRLEAIPHFVTLIVGLGTELPDLRAWIWQDGNFAVVPLVRVSEGEG